MKIAQISPLIESVPPKLYGGTERVVSYLTEELVRLGHDVTLFASGDSRTSARLVPGCDSALRLSQRPRDPVASHLVMLDRLRRRAGEFDILHFHIDCLQFPLFRDMADRTLTTLHGRLDMPDLAALFREYPELPLVSIAAHQRGPVPEANWLGTVYHGLPADLVSREPAAPRGYLAYLGRMSGEKRPDRAIEIAQRVGLPLKLAAKVDKADMEYFDETIRPLLDDPLVEFVGEIGDSEKQAFLGNAIALLFPVDWPEPFGLVMIEAMACGTPVVAWNCGSVPEIIEDGVTGFIVESIDEAVEAVRKCSALDRAGVRHRFDGRFTAERMARDYIRLYETLLASADRPAPAIAATLGMEAPVGVSPANDAPVLRAEARDLAANGLRR